MQSFKCLNACEWVEVVERNKTWSPPFPCCPVNSECLKEWMQLADITLRPFNKALL